MSSTEFRLFRTRDRSVSADRTMATGNIVAEWLRSLHLGQYAESFIDNGYDDLEICKQVGDPDLDAIGVFNPVHRSRLLQSVRTLREEGAASVYFTLEETAAVHEECFCDNLSARSSRTSSGRSEKDVATCSRITVSPGTSSSQDSGQEAAKYLDEYEEGKAELVRIPRVQLKKLLREKLAQDGIRLDCQPYSTPVSGKPTCSSVSHVLASKCLFSFLVFMFPFSIYMCVAPHRQVHSKFISFLLIGLLESDRRKEDIWVSLKRFYLILFPGFS